MGKFAPSAGMSGLPLSRVPSRDCPYSNTKVTVNECLKDLLLRRMAKAISLQQRSPGLQILAGIINRKNMNAIKNRAFSVNLNKSAQISKSMLMKRHFNR